MDEALRLARIEEGRPVLRLDPPLRSPHPLRRRREPFRRASTPPNPYLGEIAFTDRQIARLMAVPRCERPPRRPLHRPGRRPRREPGRARGEHPRLLRLPGGHPRPADRRHALPGAPGRDVSPETVATSSTSCPRSARWPACPSRPRSRAGASSRRSSRRAPRRTRAGLLRDLSTPASTTAGPTSGASRTAATSSSWPPCPSSTTSWPDPGEAKNLVYLEKKVYEDLSARAEAFMAEAEPERLRGGLSTRSTRRPARSWPPSATSARSRTPPSSRGRSWPIPGTRSASSTSSPRPGRSGMNGKPDEAIRIIQGIIAADPDITDAYFSLGNILSKARKFEEAIGYFQPGPRASSPTIPSPSSTSPLSYEAMGRFDEAEKFVLDYMAKGFKDSQFYFMLGNIELPPEEVRPGHPLLRKVPVLQSPSRPAPTTCWPRSTSSKTTSTGPSRHLSQALGDQPHVSRAVHYNRAQVAKSRAGWPRPRRALPEGDRGSPPGISGASTTCPASTGDGPAKDEESGIPRQKTSRPTPLSPAYFYLARIYLSRSERYEEAIDAGQEGDRAQARARPSCRWAISSWPTSTTGSGRTPCRRRTPGRGRPPRPRPPRPPK